MRKLSKTLCPSQSSFACIGGTRQRNIMTLNQIYLMLWGYVLHFLLEALILLTYFFFEESMGADLAIIILSVFWSCSYSTSTILVPLLVLFKSRQMYPDIWSFSPPEKYKFKELKSHSIYTASQTPICNIENQQECSSSRPETLNPMYF